MGVDFLAFFSSLGHAARVTNQTLEGIKIILEFPYFSGRSDEGPNLIFLFLPCIPQGLTVPFWFLGIEKGYLFSGHHIG